MLQKIKNRGFLIGDEQRCKKILSTIGYYRLSAYFLPFKKKDGSYVSGIDFERIYRIYEFDRRLRKVIFSAIEVIEIHLRCSLSQYHAMKYGALGYMDPSCFHVNHNAVVFSEIIQREIKSNDTLLFVKHHQIKYDGQFPLWVVSELFTFGTLSRFYTDMKRSDQKAFAGREHKEVISWLRCCTDLRNICAHYGRLYYRVFSAMPSGLMLKEHEKRRLWGAILCVKELFPFAEQWNTEILTQLDALFEEYDADIDLYHLAFPPDWKERLLIPMQNNPD